MARKLLALIHGEQAMKMSAEEIYDLAMKQSQPTPQAKPQPFQPVADPEQRAKTNQMMAEIMQEAEEASGRSQEHQKKPLPPKKT